MTAIETLISVLCDPEGKCCISGSDDDRRLIDSALAEIAQAAQPAPAQADSVLEDAARYRFLRDGEWRDTDLEPFIRLQLNTLWDAKIDAARAAQEGGK